MKCKPCLGTSNGLSLKVLITFVKTYFESITEWLPEVLGLYKIIFDGVHCSWILSLLLFTLGTVHETSCELKSCKDYETATYQTSVTNL